jgi:hypothetical protein
MPRKKIEVKAEMDRKPKKKSGGSLVRWFLIALLALLSGGRPANSQAALTCTALVSSVPSARWEGLAERVADPLLICSGGTPNVLLTGNFQIFLNVNITSNLLDQETNPTTEALFLLNNPAPGQQTLGFNVFRGRKISNNSIIWPGVTFAPDSGGNVLFRITNIRVDANSLSPGPLPAQVLALISFSGAVGIPIINPTPILGFVVRGMNFITSDLTPSSFNLNFRENFPAAFRKKIEVSAAGEPVNQNTPGFDYLTESGFMTNFSAIDTTGRADSGTRLVARFKNLPNGTSLVVPTTVQSNNSTLLARLLTQINPDYSGGQPAATGSLPVCQNSTHAVYEIEAPAGITGAAAIDMFTFPVTVLGPLGFGGGVVNGNLGPISAVGVMSLEAPEPRFVDQALEAFPWLPCLTYLPLTIK